MDPALLKPGHRIRTRDGREAEVLEEALEGGAVRVAYLVPYGPFGVPGRTGGEDLLGGGEVEALLGAVPPDSWRERVAIVLHHVPESDEGPAEYRAETISGVPNDVKVEGGGGSARTALEHLLGGLWLMGFRGTVEVSEGSGDTGEAFRRYEVEVSADG